MLSPAMAVAHTLATKAAITTSASNNCDAVPGVLFLNTCINRT